MCKHVAIWFSMLVGLSLMAHAQVESRFIPLTNPCRVVNTKGPIGPFGGPLLAGGTTREFDLPNGACGIPSSGVSAYALNITVVPKVQLGFLTMFASGQIQPMTSNLNSTDGRAKAVFAIVPAGRNEGVSAFASNDTDLILDISGYFVSDGNPSALAFYPLTPCRVADTRNPPGPFGAPFLSGGVARTFPILSSPCTASVPPGVQAYSMNFTVVPHGPLGFLIAWPAGQPQPVASTLNAPTGATTANADIVRAGTNGDVSVLASNDTDLVIDINGYFAPPGPGGLSYFPLTPCRVLDTRGSPPFTGSLGINVVASGCGAPISSQAFVLNATVIPPGSLGFFTLSSSCTANPPTFSTLNAPDGIVTSNMAIIATTDGSVCAFASNPTQLALDILGYFAP